MSLKLGLVNTGLHITALSRVKIFEVQYAHMCVKLWDKKVIIQSLRFSRNNPTFMKSKISLMCSD
jgi:hypothetical protein